MCLYTFGMIVTDKQFMYLTVPLPIVQTRLFKLVFVPRDPLQAPMKVRLLIPQNASFQKIKERIGSLLKVNPSHVRLDADSWADFSLSLLTYGTATFTRGSTIPITIQSVKITTMLSFTISGYPLPRASGSLELSLRMDPLLFPS